MLEIIQNVKETVPNSEFSIKPKISMHYEPDKNGYFVCKDNMLVTNTNLCKQYQGKKFNRSDYNQPFNLNCVTCTLKIENIKGKTLNEFYKLSAELEQLTKEKYITPKFEYHNSELEVEELSPAEKQAEKINDFINYGEELVFS